MTFIASIGLPEIIAGCIMLALNAYVLTGGADFGGGVWDLLASEPRRAWRIRTRPAPVRAARTS